MHLSDKVHMHCVRNVCEYKLCCRVDEDHKSDLRHIWLPATAYIRDWPAPGSEDTELGVLMELEVGHGATEVYAGVQA